MENETPVRKIELGLYRHFKGGEYRTIGTCKHSETLEDLVIYEALYDNKKSKIWVRPYDDFIGYKTFDDGTKVKRFEYLGPEK